jgi:pilus assembly protein Flp/PilA
MLGHIIRGHRTVRRNEEGASAVEYGLLISLIAAIIVVATLALGSLTGAMFDGTCQSISNQGTVTTTSC